MIDTRLPTEVELAYEVMPCNALRCAQEPGEPLSHPCAYFRAWGRYHSYDYEADRPPATTGIVHPIKYVGRAALVPELLSGCRKAPIMAVGINPNLPGWWPFSRNAINPLFDDYQQYAHYFRWRTRDKLQIPKAAYRGFLSERPDSPLERFELDVPTDADGVASIPVERRAMTMYENYQSLLDDLAKEMGWAAHALVVGEDLSYGNMVACPSAKWITKQDPNDPLMPPMTPAQQRGIVGECFHERRYFLRQLLQSLPAVLMVFSQSTADAFIGEMQGRFSKGSPEPGDRVRDLLEQEIRLRFGTLPDVGTLEARVIFSPHITGDPSNFGPARAKVLAQLVDEARAGGIQLNAATGHLRRPVGACTFCPTLEIGPCDYVQELRPLEPPLDAPMLAAGAPPDDVARSRRAHAELLSQFLAAGAAPAGPPDAALAAAGADTAPPATSDVGWALSGDPERQPDRRDAIASARDLTAPMVAPPQEPA